MENQVKRLSTILCRARDGLAIIAVAVAVAAPVPLHAEATPPVPLATLKQRYHRPDAVPFPPNNPFSAAKADLGLSLFFDPRLSGPATMSCGTCHNPSMAWKDGLAVGVGSDAKPLARATPPIMNLAWGELMMWDGRKDSLEDQATGPMISAAEMNATLPEIMSRLSRMPLYRDKFQSAFGDNKITPERVSAAIATFERTVVSGKAPFDHWIDGDEAAIGDAAKRGFVLFNGPANCAACHSGWRFTDDGFHDIGLASTDPGRGAQLPGVASLMHAFKTPTLRNIDQRAPYMHDGSVKTLAAVMRHYATGFLQRPSLSAEMHRLALSNQDVTDLVAFMHTLTSQDPAIKLPTLPTTEEEG